MEKKKKQPPKGKVENYFGSASYDVLSDEDIYEMEPSNSDKEIEKSKAALMKDETTKDYDSQFRGKLLRMFNRVDAKEMMIQQQTSSTSVSEIPSTPIYETKDYVYIQMKQNIEHLSESFQEELEEYRLSGINVRRADVNDLDIFVKLYNRAFMRGSDPWSPATNEQFLEILNSKNTVVLIGSSHGEDVGFIITDLEGESLEIGVICGLGTDPRWQRKGIARYLGIASWDYFRELNVKELRCEVYENNIPSYKLIKSWHFEEYGKKTYQF
ncbi:hypothetical protein NEF87_004741 [Candidatus Lokiarchaeum ossiferum]|uniref:N-acetyltransferase domain-containing protein n=1 Tax=Candidatus Lokiarchaeum ossiferum TaxID=2951803 RepID=A0ABY6HYP3_9ARCH|nr:hypothetical protein NEF87_004741 [Candidatus Lokiarchaeum sp. B-35]